LKDSNLELNEEESKDSDLELNKEKFKLELTQNIQMKHTVI